MQLLANGDNTLRGCRVGECLNHRLGDQLHFDSSRFGTLKEVWVALDGILGCEQLDD